MNNVIDNICPYCREHIISNKKVFANHVRWRKQNPKYDEIKNSTISKLNDYNKQFKKSFEVRCHTCGKVFNVVEDYRKFPIKEKYFCCRSCANTRKHSEETKQKISKSIRNILISGRNIGFVHSIGQVKKCKYCGKVITGNKKFCSKECYKLYRCINSKNKELKIYLAYCKFNFSLNRYKDEFNFDLIKEYGWYKPTNHGNNLNGVSRDHKFSQYEGWKQKIDPYIISHPANCEIMQHSQNSSKHNKCSLSIEDLIKNIKIWNNKYGEYENKIDYEVFKKLNITFNVLY